MERHNRKSHLAPQLSPSTQALLRGETVASPSKESSASKTPTSGEIPIVGGADMKASPPLDMSAIERALPVEVNGTSLYPTPPSSYERPIFPPRTSSSSASQSSRSRDSEIFYPVTVAQSRPRDTDNMTSTTVLQTRPRDIENINSTTVIENRPREIDVYSSPTVPPSRPAPPPTGPLPAPPNANFRASILRRQTTNGLTYTNGEQPPYQ